MTKNRGSITLNETISVSTIGLVKNQFEGNTLGEEMRFHPTQIVLKAEFEVGLLGLKVGMDILVLFCFHEVQPNEIKLQLHPPHNSDNPLRGDFATRSQFRPNRMGAT